jgi:hypothetical protein
LAVGRGERDSAGEWTAPLLGRVPFAEFGERWIKEHRLGERTREEYQSLWRNHVVPFLGAIELAEFSTGTIRSWRAALLREGLLTMDGSSAIRAGSREPVNTARRSG